MKKLVLLLVLAACSKSRASIAPFGPCSKDTDCNLKQTCRGGTCGGGDEGTLTITQVTGLGAGGAVGADNRIRITGATFAADAVVTLFTDQAHTLLVTDASATSIVASLPTTLVLGQSGLSGELKVAVGEQEATAQVQLLRGERGETGATGAPGTVGPVFTGDLTVTGKLTVQNGANPRIYRKFIGPSQFAGVETGKTLWDPYPESGGGNSLIAICRGAGDTQFMSSYLDLPEGATPTALTCTASQQTAAASSLFMRLRPTRVGEELTLDRVVSTKICLKVEVPSPAVNDPDWFPVVKTYSDTSPNSTACPTTSYGGDVTTQRGYVLSLEATNADGGACVFNCVLSYTLDTL